MKASDVVNAFVHFFNDIVGSLIPGVVLVLGVCYVQYEASMFERIKPYMDNSAFVVIFLLLGYAAGHGLLGVRGFLVRNLLNKIKAHSQAENSEMYRLFRSVCLNKLKEKTKNIESINSQIESSLTFFDMRNMAMTICKEAGDLARRFMFISLLSYGVSAALIIVGIFYGVVHFPVPFDWKTTLCAWSISAIIILVALAFQMRGLEFEKRAYSAPFSVALASLLVNTNNSIAANNDGK